MRLPVFRAFGSSFIFMFANLGEIVRIAWLPLLLLYMAIIASVYLLYLPFVPNLLELPIGAHSRMSPQEAAEATASLFRAFGIILLAGLVFAPMVYAGLLRFVVRGERVTGFFYLRYGADELRILATMILAQFVTMGVAIATGILLFAIVFGVGVVYEPAANAAGIVAATVFALVIIWVVLRLCLALPAAIGARGIGIGPSWAITKGNAWQLVGYWLLWLLALFVLYVVLAIAFSAFYWTEIMEAVQDAQAGANEPGNQWFYDRMIELMPQNLGQWAIWGAVQYVFEIISAGFACVVTGVPYRLLASENRA